MQAMRVLDGLAGVVLGGTLLVAGVLKALDPLAFAQQITSEGLAIVLPAMVLAVLMIAVEVGLGLALILGLRSRWLLLVTTALVGFFLFLTGRTYWLWSRGELTDPESCGCFGALVERTPAEAFWGDTLLMVPALAVLWFVYSRRRQDPVAKWRAATPVATGAAGLVFASFAPDLPLDDIATRLRPGTALADLCAGGTAPSKRACFELLVPELAAGEHWVVMSDLENQDLQPQLEGLNQASLAGKSVWLLTPDEEEAILQFQWTAGPAYQVREVPAALMRPFYRALPRSFHIADGVVTDTVSGVWVGN